MTITEARRFVAEHHRHNGPPVGGLFAGGLEPDDGGELLGVAVAGRPPGRGFDDGRTLEVTRTCTLGDDNANSMLYGAICRAGKALGWWSAITYTLPEESGASLRAAGFVLEAEIPAREAWLRPDAMRYQHDLFGEERRPAGPKYRWRRVLSRFYVPSPSTDGAEVTGGVEASVELAADA